MAKKKSKVLKCVFEWYNHKTKQAYLCGKKAKYLYQGKPLCEDCFRQSPLNNTAVEVIKEETLPV